MTFFTRLALQRPSVTVLAVILVLAGGLVTYNRLSVELFPEIEFPLITVTAFYPSANPDAVVSDVTAPIEDSISGISGLEDVQSISTENRSVVLANFQFGTDMAEVENVINSNLSAVQFPAGAGKAWVHVFRSTGDVGAGSKTGSTLLTVSAKDTVSLTPSLSVAVITTVSLWAGPSVVLNDHDQVPLFVPVFEIAPMDAEMVTLSAE